MFKTFLKYIDGNKTIIGLLLINIIQIDSIALMLNGWLPIVKILIYIFTGVGAMHHIKKGKLTKHTN